ncbi:glycosyltransferase [Lysobacter pythonis]|uniref:Glycosyltransferase n=1 Tax=Solilutibacter pythonis TaxID=2483112 RepID=A0A3M2HDH6_9GAMM|nr:glycosyltransferase [Lysobacter pythonis]RMH87751.1 glycosyltransferase [Lysobacter pythonis]
MTASALPIVLLPIGTDDAALDACLAALDRGTPAGTRVWLLDDAQAGPRGLAIIEHWLESTRLEAEYTRRQQPVGEARHLAEGIHACGDLDIAVLAPDARPAPGWLSQLAACLARDATIATATPWSNAGECVAWPNIGEVRPAPAEPGRIAHAAARMPALHHELPTAGTHAVLLRGAPRVRIGKLDGESFESWAAALTDYSLRLAAMGWRNVLCETVFVARDHEPLYGDDDLDVIAARWPDYRPRLARFLMQDPLRTARAELAACYAEAASASPQDDLFA